MFRLTGPASMGFMSSWAANLGCGTSGTLLPGAPMSCIGELGVSPTALPPSLLAWDFGVRGPAIARAWNPPRSATWMAGPKRLSRDRASQAH